MANKSVDFIWQICYIDIYSLTTEALMSLYPGQYKYIVEFEKTLAKGVANGLTVTDKLHFVSEKDAKLWIDAVSKLNRDGKYSNFKVRAA